MDPVASEKSFTVIVAVASFVSFVAALSGTLLWH